MSEQCDRMVRCCGIAAVFLLGCGAQDEPSLSNGTQVPVEQSSLEQPSLEAAALVSCTRESDCGGLACVAGTCQPCAAHGQCGSDVCDQGAATSMGPGMCVPQTSVVYVDTTSPTCPMGDGSRTSPVCDIRDAIPRAVGSKYAVRVYPGQYNNFAVDHRTLYVFGPGDGSVVVGQEDIGAGVRVINGARAVLDGLDYGRSVRTGVTCADSDLKVLRGTARGDSMGIRAVDCTLEIDHVRARGPDFGLRIDGTGNYRVTNSYFIGGRFPSVVFGGPSSGLFAFNTVTGGGSSDFPGGIDCGPTRRLIRDSIVVGNAPAEGGAQTTGACTHARVVVGSQDTRPDAGLIKLDPDLDAQGRLLDTPADAACCIDKGARFVSSLYRDFFGTPRPQGSSNDIGAHELPQVVVASSDAHIRTDLDIRRNDNYGCQESIEVGTSRGGGGISPGDPDAMRALVQFDLSGLQAFPFVQSAVLEMTLSGFDGGLPSSGYQVQVHRIVPSGSRTPWQEGDGVEGAIVPAGCTDVNAASGVAWVGAEDGGDQLNQTQPDFDGDVLATARISQATNVPGDVIRWDITRLVQDWKSGAAPNFGIMLRDVTGDGSFRGVRFGARDGRLRGFPGAVKGPRLIVTLGPQQQRRTPACARLGFPSVPWPSTGRDPASVAVVDVNGDGKPDLVTANEAGTVSVLLGNGNGTFGANVDYPAGAGATSVAVMDVDGDGKPDIVTANRLADTVSVLLGKGDGRFRAGVDYPTGSTPSWVVAADVSGDGRPDLVVANLGDTKVSVLLGNGDGTFGPKVDYPIGGSPRSVAVADVNGDGKPDLVTANPGPNMVSVLLGNGNGTFGASVDYPTGASPFAAAAADVNGDGKLDVVTANNRANTVSVLLGNGDGTFGPRVDYPTDPEPDAIAVADLSGDGKPDLMTVSFFSNTVSVLLGNGDGTFQARVDYQTGSVPFSVAAADVSGDGRPDLVVANHNDATMTVLLGKGDGTFPITPAYPTGLDPTSVAVADINGDHKPDLIVANGGADNASALLGNGDGTFAPRVDYPTGPGPEAVAVVDVSGDGTPDLLTVNRDGTASVLLGDGHGTFGAKVDYPAGPSPSSMAVADVSGDGKPDIIVANSIADTVSVLLGNGDGTFGARVAYPTGSDPVSVAVADVNGDGKPDLIVANLLANTASVLLGNGDGTFASKVDYPTGRFPGSVAVVDVSGDGKPDILAANQDSNTVSVLLGNGDGTFAPKADFSTGSGPRSLAVADVNDDGTPDIVVVTSESGHPVNVLLGNSNGTFRGKAAYLVGRFARSVTVADVSGDRLNDLLVIDGQGSTVSVLLATCLP